MLQNCIQLFTLRGPSITFTIFKRYLTAMKYLKYWFENLFVHNDTHLLWVNTSDGFSNTNFATNCATRHEATKKHLGKHIPLKLSLFESHCFMSAFIDPSISYKDTAHGVQTHPGILLSSLYSSINPTFGTQRKRCR